MATSLFLNAFQFVMYFLIQYYNTVTIPKVGFCCYFHLFGSICSPRSAHETLFSKHCKNSGAKSICQAVICIVMQEISI